MPTSMPSPRREPRVTSRIPIVWVFNMHVVHMKEELDTYTWEGVPLEFN